MEKVVLYIPLRPVSNNRFYSGMHWGKRKALADRWHVAVWVALQAAGLGGVRFERCRITVTALYADRRHLIDPDNLCAKVVIDGLVRAGLLPDDAPEHVEEVVLRVRVIKPDEAPGPVPGVQVEVEERP